MSETTPVGIVQMCATSDVEANLTSALGLAREAAEAGAKMVFMPEAFAYIGSERERRQWLEPLPQGGPILARCQALARDSAVHLVFGGFHEQAADGRAHNTCVHLGPDGEIAALYRKIHLFDADLADGTRLLESRGTAPGDRAVVTNTPFGALGLTVCYDIRFPALYQRLADMGAIALTAPSAFTRTTGRDHWEVLMRARAIETQCYMIAPAQHGDHGHRGRQSWGHGLIVDPWGDVIASCDGGDGFAVADVDPARVTEVRGQLPSLANRRAFC
ncbi:MAG: carbon-nitrogen hydrolase family protein [Gammaproteobacteria bacterium]|nr:carbon-nitrogen hydrolase family protein [Gammaproteobacteria bacterium]